MSGSSAAPAASQAAPAFTTAPKLGLAGIDNADVFLRRLPEEYKHAKLPSSAAVSQRPDGNDRLLPGLRDLLRVEPRDRSLIVPSNYYAELREVGEWVSRLADEGDHQAHELLDSFRESLDLTQEAILKRYTAIVC